MAADLVAVALVEEASVAVADLVAGVPTGDNLSGNIENTGCIVLQGGYPSLF